MYKAGFTRYILYKLTVFLWLSAIIIMSDTLEIRRNHVCIENQTCLLPSAIKKEKFDSVNWEFFDAAGERAKLGFFFKKKIKRNIENRFGTRLKLTETEEDIRLELSTVYKNDTGEFFNIYVLPSSKSLNVKITLYVIYKAWISCDSQEKKELDLKNKTFNEIWSLSQSEYNIHLMECSEVKIDKTEILIMGEYMNGTNFGCITVYDFGNQINPVCSRADAVTTGNGVEKMSNNLSPIGVEKVSNDMSSNGVEKMSNNMSSILMLVLLQYFKAFQ